MRDDRDAGNVVMPGDEPHGGFKLAAGVLGSAERRVRLGRLRHLRIGIRQTEAVEIETPDMEARVVQFITPRAPVETMRDRKRGWKASAVHVQHNAFALGITWRQVTQEQRQRAMGPCDPVMLLGRVEPGGRWIRNCGVHDSAPWFHIARNGDGSFRTELHPQTFRETPKCH